MTVSIESIMCLVLVALLWGVTNPFIKRGAEGLETVKASSKLGQFFKEIGFLIKQTKYIIPFTINQIGSLFYFLALGSTDISLAVPLTNSLTFVITGITGRFLGEEKVHRNTYLGMILVLLGTALCCWGKVDEGVEV